MACAEKLHILHCEGGATLSPGHNVVEVQFISRTTDQTLATVALPHSSFDGCWNDPPPFSASGWSYHGLFVPGHGMEPEFEYVTVSIVFTPGVDQMKYAVIRPDARADLLVDAYLLGGTLPGLEQLCRLVKLAVLGQRTRRITLGLIDRLGVGTCRAARLVMTFRDEGCAAIFNPVTIWCVQANGHQDDRIATAEAKVHALLQAGALATTHLDVGYDVVAHVLPFALPNAGPELLLEAGARHERTLEAVSSRPLLCG